MTPNLGQGACQAIEDAVILADCLTREADPAAALLNYQARRKARVDAVILAALRLGRIGQMESAPARWLRDRLLTLTPASVTRRQLVRSLNFEI